MLRKNDYISKVDNYIGDRIYSLRLAQGLSWVQLSQFISVTHQQLLKYEKGINRLSVGRLILIAKAVGKDISYFYEGLNDSSNDEKAITRHQRMCIEMPRNFMKIKNSNHQATVNTLVKTLSKTA